MYDVLDHLASVMTSDEIVHDYPELTERHVRAAIAFAALREASARCARVKLLLDQNLFIRSRKNSAQTLRVRLKGRQRTRDGAQ